PPHRRRRPVRALQHDARTRPSDRAGPSVRHGRRVLWAYCGLTLLFLCAPIVIVVVVSFNATEFIQFPPHSWSLRWYRTYLGARQWLEPTLLSLRVAAVTMVLSTALGTAAAIGLTRGRFRGRRAVEFFFVSPMVVPSIVLAIGLYLLL